MTRIGLCTVLVSLATLTACGGGGTRTVTRTTTLTVTTSTATPSPTVTSPSTTTRLPPAINAPPTTYDQALAAVLQGTPVTMRRFLSPSGNFYCDLQIIDGVAACELTRTTLAPHPDAKCDPETSDRIGRLTLQDGDVGAQCNTDTIRTTPPPPVLAYGRVAAAGEGASLQCLSRRIGITCIDTDNQVGFFVSTTGYLLLR